jgi:hypothetical protein
MGGWRLRGTVYRDVVHGVAAIWICPTAVRGWVGARTFGE